MHPRQGSEPPILDVPHGRRVLVTSAMRSCLRSQWRQRERQSGAVDPPQVVSIPLGGGPARTVLTGFTAPIVGLGTHDGWLYVGETTGQVFRVRP